jgi:hypothetical protein
MEHAEPGQPWWVLVLVAVGYFLLIPGLLLGLAGQVFENISARSEAVIRRGFEQRAISRGYAFAVGLVASLVAMITCFIEWVAASLESESLSTDKLGENGLTVAIVALMAATVAIIALCPWLGSRLLLMKCRLGEPGARRTWLSRIGPIGLALVWAGLAGWLGYRLANAAVLWQVQLQFAALPANDEPLQEWLRSQPDVLDARVSRQGNVVGIECSLSAHGSHSFSYNRLTNTVVMESKSIAGESHDLQLSQAAAGFGYGDLRDVEFGKPMKKW